MKPFALADPLLDGYHTPRLRLAAPQPGDGAALLAAIEASLPLLRRFPDSLPWAQAPQDVHASEAWCQRVALVWPQGQDKIALLWMGDEVVGCAELHLRSAHCWELGFWGHPDWLGIGLYTEAMDSVLSLAFGPYGAQEVFARTDAANLAARRLCQRLGMMDGGDDHDGCLYRIRLN